METGQLAMALRNKAADVRNVNVTTGEEDQTLRDAADLLLVLAHAVEGWPVAKAFGPPGDWGYETEIGAAIAAAAVTPNVELRRGAEVPNESAAYNPSPRTEG